MTHSARTGLIAAAVIACAVAGGCRLISRSRPLDRKTASKLVRDVTVDAPWIRIPSGLPDSPGRNARAVQAYRRLAGAGVLQCDDDVANCKVGPRGRDLTYEGTVGIKVTLGFLVAGDVSAIRIIDQSAATANVTVRFRPTAVFTGHRSDLLAILEAQGDTFANDQIAGGHMASAVFHRSDEGWHLENIELLGRSGAATHRAAARDATPRPESMRNLAVTATVSVSSEEASAGQAGLKAIDGLIDATPGEASTEWVTHGEQEGAWIKLSWNAPVRVWEVLLHDRPSLADNIRAGVLLFSDGSQVSVGALPNDGSPLRVEFDPKVVGWLEFRVTSAVGANAGLAEIEVLGTPASEAELMPD